MDIGKYIRMKEKGIFSMQKLGNAIVYTVSKYDAETGDATQPEVGAIDLSVLNKQRDQIKVQLDSIDLFIADVMAIK